MDQIARSVTWTFPFGAEVRPCVPRDAGEREVFVLGGCPSALHVRWVLPADASVAEPEPADRRKKGRPRVVSPVPVDNEPWPFWDGADESARVQAWASARFRKTWGRVEPIGLINGLAGRWLKAAVFEPLHIDPRTAWLTTCLDRFGMASSVAGGLANAYRTLVAEGSAPSYRLPALPGENIIVTRALQAHRRRLNDELAAARPEKILTIGSAALQVARALFDSVGTGDPGSDLRLDTYGTWVPAKLHGRKVYWLPLAQPGGATKTMDAHHEWLLRRIG